jgi:hypothetical protein
MILMISHTYRLTSTVFTKYSENFSPHALRANVTRRRLSLFIIIIIKEKDWYFGIPPLGVDFYSSIPEV